MCSTITSQKWHNIQKKIDYLINYLWQTVFGSLRKLTWSHRLRLPFELETYSGRLYLSKRICPILCNTCNLLFELKPKCMLISSPTLKKNYQLLMVDRQKIMPSSRNKCFTGKNANWWAVSERMNHSHLTNKQSNMWRTVGVSLKKKIPCLHASPDDY